VRVFPAVKVLAVPAAFSLFAWVAHAATSDNGDVSITIQSIDALGVTDGGAILLTGTAGQNALTGTPESSARLNYSHNSATAKKIVAEVKAADNPAGHDITLQASVSGGSGTKTLVLSGAVQGPVELVANMAAGAYSQRTVTYAASCTASGTRVGADTDFVFTVTFTSTD